MQFERGCICSPRECRSVLNQDVIDIGSAGATRNRVRLDPFGREAWRVLFPIRFSGHAIGISFQGDGPVPQMRQEERSNAYIVVNDLRFAELGSRIQNLSQPGALHSVAIMSSVTSSGLLDGTGRDRRAFVCFRGTLLFCG